MKRYRIAAIVTGGISSEQTTPENDDGQAKVTDYLAMIDLESIAFDSHDSSSSLDDANSSVAAISSSSSGVGRGEVECKYRDINSSSSGSLGGVCEVDRGNEGAGGERGGCAFKVKCAARRGIVAVQGRNWTKVFDVEEDEGEEEEEEDEDEDEDGMDVE